ncbi:MAG: DUF1801 domain-containing protein [Casimicrobium sp.]
MTAKSVEALISDIQILGSDQHAVVIAVRKLIHQQFKPCAEEVKYGGILFAAGVPFCGLFAYKAHVSLELSHGALIDDSHGLLEGAGKGRRHLKLTTVADIKAKKVSEYLTLAHAAAKRAL